jgi:DNA-binding beta-propeller fold protein YncE
MLHNRILALTLVLVSVPATGSTPPLPQFQFTYGAAVLAGPVAIAAGGDARVYVADPPGRCIVVFSEAGAPLGTWPVDAAPWGVAVDAGGTVWVATSDSGDVRAYSPEGVPLRRIPHDDVSGPGRLVAPRGIGIGPDGDVFVADDVRDVVARFAPDGTFRGEWATSPGIGNTAAFTTHPALAVLPDTSALVVVPWFSEVRRYSASGDLLGYLQPLPSPWGTPGGVTRSEATGLVYVAYSDGITALAAGLDTVGTVPEAPGVWESPTAMACDASGHLHVVCPQAHVVARFGLDPTPVRRATWGEVKARWR